MKVMCQVGAYAGQVRDFPPHIAKALLNTKRATFIDGLEDVGPIDTATAEPEAERAVVNKSGRRKRNK